MTRNRGEWFQVEPRIRTRSVRKKGKAAIPEVGPVEVFGEAETVKDHGLENMTSPANIVETDVANTKTLLMGEAGGNILEYVKQKVGQSPVEVEIEDSTGGKKKINVTRFEDYVEVRKKDNKEGVLNEVILKDEEAEKIYFELLRKVLEENLRFHGEMKDGRLVTTSDLDSNVCKYILGLAGMSVEKALPVQKGGLEAGAVMIDTGKGQGVVLENIEDKPTLVLDHHGEDSFDNSTARILLDALREVGLIGANESADVERVVRLVDLQDNARLPVGLPETRSERRKFYRDSYPRTVLACANDIPVEVLVDLVKGEGVVDSGALKEITQKDIDEHPGLKQVRSERQANGTYKEVERDVVWLARQRVEKAIKEFQDPARTALVQLKDGEVVVISLRNGNFANRDKFMVQLYGYGAKYHVVYTIPNDSLGSGAGFSVNALVEEGNLNPDTGRIGPKSAKELEALFGSIRDAADEKRRNEMVVVRQLFMISPPKRRQKTGDPLPTPTVSLETLIAKLNGGTLEGVNYLQDPVGSAEGKTTSEWGTELPNALALVIKGREVVEKEKKKAKEDKNAAAAEAVHAVVVQPEAGGGPETGEQNITLDKALEIFASAQKRLKERSGGKPPLNGEWLKRDANEVSGSAGSVDRLVVTVPEEGLNTAHVEEAPLLTIINGDLGESGEQSVQVENSVPVAPPNDTGAHTPLPLSQASVTPSRVGGENAGSRVLKWLKKIR